MSQIFFLWFADDADFFPALSFKTSSTVRALPPTPRFQKELSRMLGAHSFEARQADAIRLLGNSVALIQGPPGTGGRPYLCVPICHPPCLR